VGVRPRFPRLKKFLDFWSRNLDGKLHRLRQCPCRLLARLRLRDHGPRDVAPHPTPGLVCWVLSGFQRGLADLACVTMSIARGQWRLRVCGLGQTSVARRRVRVVCCAIRVLCRWPQRDVQPIMVSAGHVDTSDSLPRKSNPSAPTCPV
jgi:hypothetical protein